MKSEFGTSGHANDTSTLDSSEVIMGLRWDIEEHRAHSSSAHADLDAFCVLFDARSQLMELVHPGRTRNTNGSVVHTGDSTTGAGEWDDERLFVFIDALPEGVCALAFVVISAAGHVFADVPGASCHVSDRLTEREYVRVNLPRDGLSMARCIATLQRTLNGWKIFDRAESGAMAITAESLSLSVNEKAAGGERSGG
jgi:stress response protein SCP2